MVCLPFCALAQAPALSARIDAATYQRVVEENLDLRKEQTRLDGEMGDLRRKDASLLLEIQDLERRREQLMTLISQLKTPDEVSAQLVRLQAEKEALANDVERLRKIVAAMSPPPVNQIPAVVTPAPGSDLFRKLEQENSDLRQEMAKVREAEIKGSLAKQALSKNEIDLKEKVARLEEQYKKVSKEFEVVLKRESALKKAVESQAKKAFEADKALKETLELQAKKAKEAEVARQKALEVDAPLKKPDTTINVLRPTSVGDKGQAQHPPTQSTVATAGRPAAVADLLAAGQKSLTAGRVQEAEKLYLQALKREPKNAGVSYNLGVLYGDYLKDYRKALTYYQKYLELAPNAPDAALVRSWMVDLKARANW